MKKPVFFIILALCVCTIITMSFFLFAAREGHIRPQQKTYPEGTTEITGKWIISGGKGFFSSSRYQLEKQIDGIWSLVGETDQPFDDVLIWRRNKDLTEFDLSIYSSGLDSGHYRIYFETIETRGNQEKGFVYCYFEVR